MIDFIAVVVMLAGSVVALEQRDGVDVFARVLGDADRPALLFLQGGPGSPAPREHFAWMDTALRRGYQVVIVGGGGHGLATAYYLARRHGIGEGAGDGQRGGPRRDRDPVA